MKKAGSRCPNICSKQQKIQPEFKSRKINITSFCGMALLENNDKM
jgi:hypothetical protein